MHCLKLCFLVISILAFGSEAQNEEALPLELTRKLVNLLKPFREISLLLRRKEDASNRFMQFFLAQSLCPVKVFFNSTSDRRQNRNNVLRAQVGELKSLIDIYSSRLGTQFFIMDSGFELDAVTDVSRAIWNRWGIFKNYYLTSENVYFYNPFVARTQGNYGALQNATHDACFEEVLENLNGYPLRTHIFRSVYANLKYDKKSGKIKYADGADAYVAYSIEKAMNCKLVLQEPDEAFFGHRLANGTFDGAIGRTIRYETDLTLTGFFVKDYRTRDMEFSVTVYMDKLCCYVSKAKRVPQSILPLFSVKKDMWLGFIGTAFLWAAIWAVIRKCNLWIVRKDPSDNKIVHSYQYIRILIDTWVIWVRVNITHYPPFSSEKIFVISLCLVSVIFGAIFESSLATVYINPLYYKDINTLQELDESQFKILIKHAAMKDDLFSGSSSPIFQRLDIKLLYVTEMEDRVIAIMAKRGGFASVTRASSLILDDISYILSKTIHQIPECPKTYHIAYAIAKESPFKQRVDGLLLRFLNAGLINHWIEMMYHQAKIGILNSPEILKVMGGDKWKVLTVKDLQLAFYVVVLGGLLSMVVLVAEIFVAKRCEWGRELRKAQ